MTGAYLGATETSDAAPIAAPQASELSRVITELQMTRAGSLEAR